MEKIKMGIVGLGQRGSCLIETVMACEEAEIVAVCDVYEDRCVSACEKIQKEKGYSPIVYERYEDMLSDKNVDGVLICSSWDEHIRMAVQSMKAGKITAMEVGCAYDVEECWELVRAYEETKTPFMMTENCCFDSFELLSTSLARAGKFGEIVHCHGAYCHDLRDEILGGYINRHYRLDNYKKRNCENYPTHELGPIAKLLDINRGNRIVQLTSMASKAAGLKEFIKSGRSPDPSLTDCTFAQGDIVSTTILCANGETITLTLDTTLPKYYTREFTVRGTKGFSSQETNMVLLEEDHNMHEFWEYPKMIEKHLNNAKAYEEKYLPSVWKNITEEEKKLGHGGMDYLMLKAFFKAVINGEEMPVDVYDAATWLCISALSAQSIAQGGALQSVPDFTKGKWIKRKRLDVTEF
jgi:hypothetical protein